MQQDVIPELQIISWSNIREQVQQVQSELADIIDDIPNVDNMPLIKARYRYGAKIIKNGITLLPINKHKIVPLGDDQVPDCINTALNYNNMIPMGMVLTKTIEVFFETPNRVMPSRVMRKGDTFGLWEVFDPPQTEFVKRVWNITAGARTVFSLAKISNKKGHSKLQNEFGIKTDAPINLFEHYYTFKSLSKSITTETSWECEILFFTKSWFENKDKNLRLKNLYQYWLLQAWKQSFTCRNNMDRDLAWEILAKEVSNRNWMPKPLLINTLKHLIAISESIYPGFVVARTEELLPLSLLQRVYTEIYKLEYPLIVMQPQTLAISKCPIYYSLSLPTLLEYPITARNKSRMVNDLFELKKLIKLFQEQSKNTCCEYDFFHCSSDVLNKIKLAQDLFTLDPQFNIMDNKAPSNFPYNSPFFKGCIQITCSQRFATERKTVIEKERQNKSTEEA